MIGHEQQTSHRTCLHTSARTHMHFDNVRHVDSLLPCPFGVVAFMSASRSALQGLSGEKQTERERWSESEINVLPVLSSF